MRKSKKEIEDILNTEATNTLPQSFYLLAVIKPVKGKKMISLYNDNLAAWISMPMDDIIEVEEIDTVKIDGELCKFVELEIKIPAEKNHYQLMLMDALMSVSGLAAKDKCGCHENGGKNPPPKTYKMAHRKPIKATKDCYHCKLINGEWWCINWCW